MSIAVLGSTGSIGTQALEVMHSHGLRPAVLAAGRSAALMETQARRFRPEAVCLEDETAARRLKTALADTGIRVLSGRAGILECAVWPSADRVLAAMVGMAGLEPALCAVTAGKTLLLANKEALVAGGSLIMNAARDNQADVLPVDSEHSAVFQCLQAGRQGLRRILLTASGGPFLGWDRARLTTVTPEMALCHPNWSMGPKVTCDSALLINKGLEVMEAVHLFGLPPEKIEVVVHPQSVVHSLIEYEDGALLAQLGAPDMRLPIQYALLYPRRAPCPGPCMNLTQAGTLTFSPPDLETFPSLALAYEAARLGGSAGAVYNAAAEAAVTAFLAGRGDFAGIPGKIERALSAAPFIPNPTLHELLEITAQIQRLFS